MRQIRGSIHCWLGLALMLAMTIIAACPIQAHDIEPGKSEPAPGAALVQSPTKVTVWFPENVVVPTSVPEEESISTEPVPRQSLLVALIIAGAAMLVIIIIGGILFFRRKVMKSS